MLPSFRTKAAHDYGPHNRKGGIEATFIQDWVEIIHLAVLLLKPTDTDGCHDLIRKEIKVITEAVIKTKRNAKKIKCNIDEMAGQVDRFRRKLFRRLKVTEEWALDMERKLEPEVYPEACQRKISGIAGPEIYENHLFMQTGNFGLYMKRELPEYWLPFTDLNFLERRVILLGMTGMNEKRIFVDIH